MAIIYGKKKRRQNNIIFTLVTTLLICTIFAVTVSSFYQDAKEEAYEMLHIQTKQIKDDLVLQLKSDRENLATMANFAAKLHENGEDYDYIFDAFNPIGMISGIGVLEPDGTFVTKVGSMNIADKISYEEELAKGEYISGRVEDITREGQQIVRSAVPIISGGESIGILYGVIKLDVINEKYGRMAKELDAQLFVYDKETGKFLIDTIDKNPGALSNFATRVYNDDYSYDKLVTQDNGYSSFKSILTGEDLYIHYSTIEDFDWGIMMARYETQVFNKTHHLSRLLAKTFGAMAIAVTLYFIVIMKKERSKTYITTQASNIRKMLLEANRENKNVYEALKTIREIAMARSAFYVDTDGEDYNDIQSALSGELLVEGERTYFVSEIFRYAVDLYNLKHLPLAMMTIVPGSHMMKTNPKLYEFMSMHHITDVTVAIITDKNNHIGILGTINNRKNQIIRNLLEEIAVCFSIAIFNKKHLKKTEQAATTDALTGAQNRVAYKRDVVQFDEEKPEQFSCLYVDVNELHARNNKYGHAAGDEMLIFIANTLKDVFYGHHIYRMGGDEFLVFAKNVKQDDIKESIETFIDQLKSVNYNVAIGMSYRTQNMNCEEMVREAEVRMYEAKARYYQNKENASVAQEEENNYVRTKTGIREIDTMLSVLKEHYNGIYRVSLDTDSAHRILMPGYLHYNENENNFSKLLSKYIEEMVHPDFHRTVSSFLNYDALKQQMMEGSIPHTTFKKVNGETVVLSVYKLEEETANPQETLWVFAKG